MSRDSRMRWLRGRSAALSFGTCLAAVLALLGVVIGAVPSAASGSGEVTISNIKITTGVTLQSYLDQSKDQGSPVYESTSPATVGAEVIFDTKFEGFSSAENCKITWSLEEGP